MHEKIAKYLKERQELLNRVAQEIQELKAALAFVEANPGAGYLVALADKFKGGSER